MKYFLLTGVLVFTMTAASQEVPATTEQQLENLSEENPDDDALLQQLAFYQKHPVNLNTASAEDLYPLRMLSPIQIQNLLRYRAAFGKLLSLYELQAVPGFDLMTIRKILPYVFAGEAQTAKEMFAARLRGGSQTMLFRISRVLEKAKGYDVSLKTPYLGDPNHLLLRYTYQYKTLLYYGFTADKDAGERFFKGAQKQGFDFYAFHFFARNLGKIKALALGDFVVNFGQGLTQWQSQAFGKSADVVALKRQSPVLLPYRSAGEFFFNRGAAATLQFGKWEATTFFSGKKFSGNLALDSVERFTSFGTSGYYRTKAETEEKNKLTAVSAGGNLAYRNSRFNAGLNAVLHRFSLPLQKSDAPYNRFAFSGNELLLASIDYSYTFRNVHLFGELASDQYHHTAFVQGALISVDSKMDLSFFYRNIPKDYQAPFANAFTENSLPSNETGFYTGLQLRPAAGWQVAAYADFYRFPFLKYRVSSPSRGADYLLQVSYAPDKKTELYLHYRTEAKPLNETGASSVLAFPVDQLKQNLRLNLATQLNRKLTLKARTELLWFAGNGHEEQGFLMYVETAVAPTKKWNTNLRLQYFETGGYDSRLYAYESDVLYGFSIPGFFDKGFRYYVNVSHDLTKRFTFWIRVSQTNYLQAETIGSGLDEINGHTKTEVKLQLRYSFN